MCTVGRSSGEKSVEQASESFGSNDGMSFGQRTPQCRDLFYVLFVASIFKLWADRKAASSWKHNQPCGSAIPVPLASMFSAFLIVSRPFFFASGTTLWATGIQTMQLFTLYSTAQTCGFLSLDLIQSPPEANTLSEFTENTWNTSQRDSETVCRFKYVKTECRARMMDQ